MVDWADIRDEVAAVIEDTMGQEVLLYTKTEANFDPVASAWNTVTWASVSTYAVFGTYRDREIDGSRILEGDFPATLSAKDLSGPPEIGSRLVANSTTFLVVNVSRTNPAGTAIVYRLQLREGGS